MFSDGQIHIAKWVRNALDLNDGDELLFEVVDNKIIFTKAGGWEAPRCPADPKCMKRK